jgi:hypothetical protein
MGESFPYPGTRISVSRIWADLQFRDAQMANDSDDPGLIKYLKEIGAAFKLGSGVLGKSAIAFGILVVVGGIAVYRLKSDLAILGALAVLLVAFFLWFFPVMRFVEKHPEAGLLESVEWMEYHRFQAEVKGYIPEQEPTPITQGGAKVIVPQGPKPADEDARPNG